MRVAVSQFATTLNVQDNLETCIRMINQAAVCKPDLIVLPEFCNTFSWYEDHNQAWNCALTTDGTFLGRIGEKAKQHDCYIVINVTLRRDTLRDHKNGTIKSNISVTSCLFSPLGKLILQADKETLIGYENDFFISASKVSDVASTPFGKFGLFTSSDSITFETARDLTLRGAQLLCNSLSAFAIDHSNLHSPARACENKVFLAMANKVGALISEEQMALFSEKNFIPQKHLLGTGDSQIISPNGKVLAKIANNEEGFIYADIDLNESTNKIRPDGTELFKQQRPQLYQRLKLAIKQAPENECVNNTALSANVAIFATYKTDEQAIEDVCFYIENNLSDIIQLPELFFLADKKITPNSEQIIQLADFSNKLVIQVSSMLRPLQYVCTSLVIDGTHQAVLISEHGLFAAQQQLHFCQRYQWSALGDDLNIIELPLEQGSIKVAMLTADDANIPEIVKIAALNGIHLLLVPFDIQEACEIQYNLLSRAAENRICIVAASQEKSLSINSVSNNNKANGNKSKQTPQKSTGLIVNLTTDFTLLTQWKSRKFDGYINQPIVKYQHGKITKAVIHPIAADNKLMEAKTDLLRNSPWVNRFELTHYIDFNNYK